jgi:hypothetical protein
MKRWLDRGGPDVVSHDNRCLTKGKPETWQSELRVYNVGLLLYDIPSVDVGTIPDLIRASITTTTQQHKTTTNNRRSQAITVL